jgi:hypothetical protein
LALEELMYVYERLPVGVEVGREEGREGGREGGRESFFL